MTEVIEIGRAFLIMVASLGIVALWFELTFWISKR
jgi:hypothetical protein